MKKKNQKKMKLDKLIPKNWKWSSSPGTVKYVWKERKEKVNIEILNYNIDNLTEITVNDLSESLGYINKETVTWINVSWVHNEALINTIWELFNIHKLVLEDITNTTQRSKIEEYDDYIFVVLKMIYFSKEDNELIVEQVSLIVSDNYIISLQEIKWDVLDWLRERIKQVKWKIRNLWTDYLMYWIIDGIVDQYFNVIEAFSEKIEELEEELMVSSDNILLSKIYSLKKEIVFLKKSIWPLREVVLFLERWEHKLISDFTNLYFRDVYDHTIQVIETIETFRDLTSWLLDLYLSTVSNKMNEVMKVLTIFWAIFIPLTFIAGVYWMNFEYMPELWWEMSYPVFWIIIILNIVIMLYLFKRKKWL